MNLTQASTLLLAQQEPAAADPGARNPGDMLNDFFASNPWLTAIMAGVGVVLILWVILRAIWQAKEEGTGRAGLTAVRGALLAMLLFIPSLIGEIASLAYTGVTAVADWFFGLLG